MGARPSPSSARPSLHDITSDGGFDFIVMEYVARDKIVFNMGEITGNIWLAQLNAC